MKRAAQYDHEAARQRRDAEVVVELARVCAVHGAECRHVSLHGIYVTLVYPIVVRWSWSTVMREASIDVQVRGSTLEDQAEGMARMARLLRDPAFWPALDVAVTRLGPDAARALQNAMDTRNEGLRGTKYHGD